ncbi:MAG: mechanosensitive ion channel [Bacteroidetes bacterium]|nr:mechanosensitive ion channel [Bacteroidota bacterium]
MKQFAIILFLTGWLIPFSLKGQTDSLKQDLSPGFPVVYQGDTLFYLYSSIGPFTPEVRANGIVSRLDQLLATSASLNDTFSIHQRETYVDILSGEIILMSLTEEDALGGNKELIPVAQDYQKILQTAITKQIDLSSPISILSNLGLLLLAVVILWVLFWGVQKLFDLFRGNIKKLERNIFFHSNRFVQFFRFITPKRERDILLVISRTLRYTTYFLVLFFYLPFVFAYLPWTRPFAQKIWMYVSKPLSYVWDSFTSYLPNLFFILVIVIITRYTLRFLQYIATEIEKEQIVIEGFYGDWALPTFKLARVLILAFALIIMFPYLPGSDSPAFQGVSIFLGLLLSLGSSTAVANIVAGIVITYMRPFKIGDRVKIGDTVGDVMGRSLLVTRLKTIKNEEITIPNAQILSGQLKNYTSHAEELGVILNTTVTIGYDVPWKKVESMLIEAALSVDTIEKEPSPFVLKTSLDDFYISYQLNAYTRQPGKASGIYSAIHTQILDIFNREGVEILSPHYGAQRDGNTMAVPPENLPENYEAPAFRINQIIP